MNISIKAKLTALDYQLGDQRIAQTRELFEEALELGRAPDRLFEYAAFLQDNNQFTDSEKFYQEALTTYRQLAVNHPAVYRPDVAITLSEYGFAHLSWQQPKKAILYLREAEEIFAILAEQEPQLFKGKLDLTQRRLQQASETGKN